MSRRPAGPFVLVVLDGAADRLRLRGRSPLAMAKTPYLDQVAREGVTGRMTTLYHDLPQESLVAHLGMLGWDPHQYYPGGRASSELAALPGVTLGPGDVVFRANLARTESGVLTSYSARSIDSVRAARLARTVDSALRARFPEFELYHVGDYRTLLVVRGARVAPTTIRCDEPHSCEGMLLTRDQLVFPVDASSVAFAARVNEYLTLAAAMLADEPANSLLPWGMSSALALPAFASVTGFEERAAIVGAMAFLSGICAAGGLEFHEAGNGRPDSDFAQKGRLTVELLRDGYKFVCCHVNAPDEASHLHDPELKVHCLERIDTEILGPIVRALGDVGDVGGLMVLPDHYSNSSPSHSGPVRREIHSLDPVPFALWNGRERDTVPTFDEDAVVAGRYGALPLNHLQLLATLGLMPPARQTERRRPTTVP